MSQTIRDNLKRMLAPRHVAFVGGRSMARALKRCAEGGYPGQMWLINPQHESLEGVPCVRSVADLPALEGLLLGGNMLKGGLPAGYSASGLREM